MLILSTSNIALYCQDMVLFYGKCGPFDMIPIVEGHEWSSNHNPYYEQDHNNANHHGHIYVDYGHKTCKSQWLYPAQSPWSQACQSPWSYPGQSPWSYIGQSPWSQNMPITMVIFRSITMVISRRIIMVTKHANHHR